MLSCVAVNVLVVLDGVAADPVLHVGPLPPAAGHVRVLQGVMSLVHGDNPGVTCKKKSLLKLVNGFCFPDLLDNPGLSFSVSVHAIRACEGKIFAEAVSQEFIILLREAKFGFRLFS